MAPLLQSQQRKRGERAGGQTANLLMLGTAAVMAIYIFHWVRIPSQRKQESLEAPTDPDVDVWEALSESVDATVSDQLAELERNLEDVRKRGEEVDAEVEADKTRGTNQSGSRKNDTDTLPKISPVSGIGDIRSSWELIVNYAIDQMTGHCGTACEACASTLGREMVKADSLLLRGGQATVLSELKTDDDMREEVVSVQRDIGQCASRLDGDFRIKRERQQQRAKVRSAESMYKRETRETERREQEAVKYERLKQQLHDALEAEEAEERRLHDIANPIWLPDAKWAEQTDGLCTQKVMLLLEAKFPPDSRHSNEALKSKKEMFKKCVADAKASRAKLRADAGELQKELRQKRRDSVLPLVKSKHRRHEQFLKYAGIEADAIEELRDIGDEAMRVSIHNLGRSANGGRRSGTAASSRGKEAKELREGLD